MNIKHYQLIDESTASILLAEISALHSARFVPNTSNKGLNGQSGAYSSAFNSTLPKGIVEHLTAVAPRHDGMSLVEIVINKYGVGDYVPRHIDSHRYLGCEILTLADSKDGLRFIENGTEKFHQDGAGYCNEFHELKTVHWVEPVCSERYSVIFLYL